MSMANFDLIEYQKRIINDLTAENKALKEHIHGDCNYCKNNTHSVYVSPCDKCVAGITDNWEWKGVDGK